MRFDRRLLAMLVAALTVLAAGCGNYGRFMVNITCGTLDEAP